MKKHFVLFVRVLVLVYFLSGCGAGGGVSTIDNGLTGSDNDQTNNPPSSSTKARVAKIKIKEDGIYKVTFSDLLISSVDLSGTATASLKITNNREEIAIDVVDVNNIGIFDSGDYIEFYGKAIPRGDDRFRYTETNVYRLFSDNGAGKRMEKINSSASSVQGASSFLKVLHIEEDTWYEQKNYPEITSSSDRREHWFWGDLFYTPGVAGPETGYYQRDYKFSTRGVDKSQPVQLKIRFQSVSGSHHIRGFLNNADNPVIDKTFDFTEPSDKEPFYIEVDLPALYLNDVLVNTLRLESVGDTQSGDYELFYLDWFEVQYYHLYQAESSRLEFTGKGLIELSKFTSESVSVYDLSDDMNIKKILPLSVEQIQNANYKTIFSTPADEEGKFFGVTELAKKIPAAIEGYTQADTKSKDGDYIIITHKDFSDAIAPLAEYRKNQGYKVVNVKINEVYDEFGYGIETPAAIKAFLDFAYHNWSTRPKYVLLAGDATLDYKDVSGYGKDGVKNYIPTYFYNYHTLGEVPIDNWFVDVEGDILPEMNIGRIPAKTAADVSAVINKIISHEQSLNKSNNVLLVADDDLQIFNDLSDDIAKVIPASYSKTTLYQDRFVGEFKQGIIDEINSGALVLNYTGHGAVTNWTKENVFTSADVASLSNKDKYPFVVALNCLNGYFVLPNDGVIQNGEKEYPSIAESFLIAPEKGAVAVFAASSIGYPSEHDPLANALYGVLFQDGMTLGEAVTKAKEGLPDDVVQTFIFFGDPATRLR